MALVPNLAHAGVSADGTISTWSDGTVYGGANPDRNEVALYLTVYKVNEALEEESQTVSAFDPETVTSFTSTNTVDGHVKAKFAIVELYDVGTVYNRYDLVWDASGNAFYEFINVTPTAGQAVSNPLYWSLVSDPTSKIENVGTAQESGNLLYQVVDKIISYNAGKCYGNVAIDDAKNCCGSGDCENCSCENLQRIRLLYNGMVIADTRQLYLEGERIARLAEKYCEDCGCN